MYAWEDQFDYHIDDILLREFKLEELEERDILSKTKSKTKWYNFEGTCKWAKVYTPDEFRGASNWTIDFYPKDDNEVKAIKATGIQGNFKQDADGLSYIRFRRGVKKSFDQGRTFTVFAPPVIIGPNGTGVKYVNEQGEDVKSVSDGSAIKAVGEPILIGNGSRIKINVGVYDTAYGPGNRFETIEILELVEYKKPEVSDDVESDTAESSVEVDW
jgi:hypothetical protein